MEEGFLEQAVMDGLFKEEVQGLLPESSPASWSWPLCFGDLSEHIIVLDSQAPLYKYNW